MLQGQIELALFLSSSNFCGYNTTKFFLYQTVVRFSSTVVNLPPLHYSTLRCGDSDSLVSENPRRILRYAESYTVHPLKHTGINFPRLTHGNHLSTTHTQRSVRFSFLLFHPGRGAVRRLIQPYISLFLCFSQQMVHQCNLTCPSV